MLIAQEAVCQLCTKTYELYSNTEIGPTWSSPKRGRKLLLVAQLPLFLRLPSRLLPATDVPQTCSHCSYLQSRAVIVAISSHVQSF